MIEKAYILWVDIDISFITNKVFSSPGDCLTDVNNDPHI